jgi:hypothetical protein
MMSTKQPRASAPILFGEPAPAGVLLEWSWAQDRLVRARNYWVSTTRRNGAPHVRPIWGIWLDDCFWFSTGSLARHNLLANTETTVHLENGDDVVIVEGIAQHLTNREQLQRMCDVYNRKYDWTMEPAESGVTDADRGGASLSCRPPQGIRVGG